MSQIVNKSDADEKWCCCCVCMWVSVYVEASMVVPCLFSGCLFVLEGVVSYVGGWLGISIMK